LRWLRLVVLVVTGLAACGGRSDHSQRASGSGSGGEGGLAASVGSFGEAGEARLFPGLCDRYRDALCDFYLTCVGEPLGDLDHCRATLDCYGVSELRRAVALGHVTVDEAALDACLDAAKANPCFLRQPRLLLNGEYDVIEFLAACPGVVTPRQNLGDSCSGDGECEKRLECDTSTTCPGVCQLRDEVGTPCEIEQRQCSGLVGFCLGGVCRVPQPAGQSCGDDLDCERDLLCGEGTCVEPPSHPGLGGTCILDFEGAKPAVLCGPGLFCSAETSGVPGVCRALQKKGEPCDPGGCEPGLGCMALGGGPQLCYGTAGLGELCNGGAPNACEPGLTCQITSQDPFTWTCVPRFGLGDWCTSMDECADGLVCVNHCVPAAFPGDACDVLSDACQASRCEAGVCVAPGPIGAPCANASKCVTASCQNGVCVDDSSCER